MKNCPLIKSILVRTASFTLYFLSSIPVRDASNGFRLFSRKLLKQIKIESKVGFAYSLELLVKCHRLKKNIVEKEINLLEEKLNLLVKKTNALKLENDSVKPQLYDAKEEIRNLKAKIAEATVKIENLLAQIP